MAFRILISDLKKSVLERKIMIIIIAFITMLLSVLYILSVDKYYAKSGIIQASLVDGMINLFKGMHRYIPSEKNVFVVEWRYFLWNILGSLVVGYYSSRIGKDEDIYCLIKCKSWGIWYWSKILWGIIVSFIYYGLIIISIAAGMCIGCVFSKNVKYNFSLKSNDILCGNILGDNVNVIHYFKVFIMLSILSFVFIYTIQLVLTMVFNVFIGYVSVIGIIILSAYYDKWYWIANAQMMYRYYQIYTPINIIRFCVLTIAILIVIVIGGRIIMGRKDLIKK